MFGGNRIHFFFQLMMMVAEPTNPPTPSCGLWLALAGIIVLTLTTCRGSLHEDDEKA